jgi:hypothetical protein
VLAAPWLGGLVDRLPRIRLVIVVDLLLAAALLTLLAVRSREQTWLIFAVMLATGISYVLIDAGETALLPSALPPSALADVNGWRSSAQEGTRLIAPLAGAGLYAWHGGAAVAALSAAMPLAVAILYSRLRLTATPATAEPTRTPGVRAGLAVLRDVQEIRTPVLVAAVAIGLSGFTVASVYARVTEGLGLPSTFLGYWPAPRVPAPCWPGWPPAGSSPAPVRPRRRPPGWPCSRPGAWPGACRGGRR